jgi:hypothetical protein
LKDGMTVQMDKNKKGGPGGPGGGPGPEKK